MNRDLNSTLKEKLCCVLKWEPSATILCLVQLSFSLQVYVAEEVFVAYILFVCVF